MTTEEHGSHWVNVDIGLGGVIIDSKISYGGPTGINKITKDEFQTVEVARKRLNSLRALYQNFSRGYVLLGTGQFMGFLGSCGKGVADVLNNNSSDYGIDLLRFLGLVGITIVTFVAGAEAQNNSGIATNKLLAVKEAEREQVQNFQNVYPLF